MTHELFRDIQWLEPWEPAAAGLEDELAREVCSRHPLHKVNAISVGHRIDCDDVLFFLPDHAQALAVVHLTWNKEFSARWPSTAFYSSVDDWVNRCMKPDHDEYKTDVE